MADKTYSKNDLIALAHQIAVKKGVDPTLVKAVIDQESGWNPKARSPAGATGLMQLMPATAKGLGVEDSTDPIQNITGGVEYLKQQINRFGDVGLALAAYNWGPSRVAKLQYDPRSVRIPAETQNYVPGVLGRMAKFGEMLMPSSLTAALFPKTGDAMVGSLQGKIAQRTGAAPSGDIAAAVAAAGGDLQRQAAPMPASSGAVLPSPLPPESTSYLPIDAEVPEAPSAGTPVQLPEGDAQGDLAALMPRASPRQQTQSLDQFLRSRFGPLADVADPFPKTFDAELTRLIDQV